MEPNSAEWDTNAEESSLAKTCHKPVRSDETRNPETRFFQVNVSLFSKLAKKVQSLRLLSTA